MKSRIYKGLIVRSELKPTISIKDSRFIYTKGANLAEKFKAIFEAQAAAKVENVTPIKKRAVK